MPVEHGGPARVIIPKLYAWKGAKWVSEIIFLDRDILGFWEVRGYSNTADPWTDDRFLRRDPFVRILPPRSLHSHKTKQQPKRILQKEYCKKNIKPIKDFRLRAKHHFSHRPD